MSLTGTVLIDANVDEARERAIAQLEARRERRSAAAERFFGDTVIPPRADNDESFKIGRKLREWIRVGSWDECWRCGSARSRGLSESFLRGRYLAAGKCECGSPRYNVPVLGDWPTVLRGLSRKDMEILAVYKLHYGSSIRRQHGYKSKDGPVYATVRRQSVASAIAAVTNDDRKQKLHVAYEYLRACPESAYDDFINRHENDMLPAKLNCDKLFSLKYIETAMWPLLYPFRSLCETAISDTGSHKSAKKSYVIKLLSGVLDYSADFAILRFQFYRWIYKTVSGAISAACALDCSPARALDSKPFSPTYWEWQLTHIVDAVRQFGFPDIFITISPYEWTFPGAEVLAERSRHLGKGPTELASIETMHIAHILTEIMRHFVSGKGRRDWRQNLLHNAEAPACNVKTYFYRFEFQQRGTIHVHHLAWLARSSLGMARRSLETRY